MYGMGVLFHLVLLLVLLLLLGTQLATLPVTSQTTFVQKTAVTAEASRQLRLSQPGLVARRRCLVALQ